MAALSNDVVNLVVEATTISQESIITVTATAYQSLSEYITDSLTQTTSIVPKGFPRELSQGGFIGT